MTVPKCTDKCRNHRRSSFFAMSSESGEEIKEQVFEALVKEAGHYRWDPSDDCFGKLILICCGMTATRRDRGSDLSEPVRLSGRHVIEGIVEFLEEMADSIIEDAGRAEDTARELAQFEALHDDELLAEIQLALDRAYEIGDTKDFYNLRRAESQAQKAIRLLQHGMDLADRLEVLQVHDAQGFMVHYENGHPEIARILKWVEGDNERRRAGKGPRDVSNGRPCELEILDSTDWKFCTEADSAIRQHRSARGYGAVVPADQNRTGRSRSLGRVVIDAARTKRDPSLEFRGRTRFRASNRPRRQPLQHNPALFGPSPEGRDRTRPSGSGGRPVEFGRNGRGQSLPLSPTSQGLARQAVNSGESIDSHSSATRHGEVGTTSVGPAMRLHGGQDKATSSRRR
jgi:hypothetical protein